MIIGSLLAWYLPPWVTVVVALSLEVWIGYSIRDNLTLNVINLIHQFDFIKNWQAGFQR
jgi:hypothetical protein